MANGEDPEQAGDGGEQCTLWSELWGLSLALYGPNRTRASPGFYLLIYKMQGVNWVRSDHFSRVWKVWQLREVIDSGQEQVRTDGSLKLPSLGGKDSGDIACLEGHLSPF